MPEVSVHSANPGDMRALTPLVLEMLAFYETVPPLSADVFADALERDGPCESGQFDCLIAWGADGDPVGFAMYSSVYEAAFAGNGIFLRDIFVTPSARGAGVGKALFVALAKDCVARGIRRIDWHAARLDLDARTFYEIMAPDSFKLNRLSYRIEDAEIHQLSEK